MQPIPAFPPLLEYVVPLIVTDDALPSDPSIFVKPLPVLLSPPPPIVTLRVEPAVTE